MIEGFARQVPEELMDKSGMVFYSGREAFESPSRLYILGANPSGAPEAAPEKAIQKNVDSVLETEQHNWSAYRDERPQWERSPRMLHLFCKLNLDPGRVPASNLVFLRSCEFTDLGPKKVRDDIARRCWPFHQAVIEQLGVRVVVCYHREAAPWVRQRLRANRWVDSSYEQNKRQWTSDTYVSDTGLAVVRIPHLSRSDWTKPATDPTALVRRALEAS